jgi:hypothetical protein
MILMAGFNMDEPITLAHIGIEKDFNDALSKLIPLIGKGEKGTVTIKVEMARPEELDTMLTLTTSVGTSAPAPKKRKNMARIGDGKIYVEPVPIEAEPDPGLVLAFDKKESVN